MDATRVEDDEKQVFCVSAYKQSRSMTCSRLWTLVRPEAGKIITALTALLLNSTTNLCFPWIMGEAIDGREGPSIRLFVGTASVFMVGSVASWIRVYCIGTATDQIAARLRKMVFNSLLDRDVDFFQSADTGDVVTLLENDVDEASSTLTEKLSAGIRSMNSSIFGSVSLFITSPKLCAVSLSIVPLIGVGAMTLSKFTRSITERGREAHSRALSFAIERFSRYSTIRLNGREQFEKDSFAKHTEASFTPLKSKHFAQGAFMSFINLATNCSLVAVLKVGGNLIAAGSLTNGQLTRFAIQSGFVGLGFSGLSSFYRDITQGLDAAARIFEFIDATEQNRKEKNQIHPAAHDRYQDVQHSVQPSSKVPDNAITLESVTFSYSSRPDRLVFNNFSIEIPRCKFVCFKGHSGSGKSTLLSLISGLYSPISGRIFVDGVDMSTFETKYHRQLMCTKMFGVVEQASESLLSGSVAFNIKYGKDTATEEEMRHAAEAASAHNFITSFSKGYDTEVGVGGSSLSGGQRARIALARALVRDPPCLLLDEPTAALDAENEREIIRVLTRLSKTKTIIVVSHSEAVCAAADILHEL